MASVMASNYTMFVYTLAIQCEAFQMPKMIKQKVLCKVARYGSTIIHHIFSMEYKIFTDKLPATATVHFPGAK